MIERRELLKKFIRALKLLNNFERFTQNVYSRSVVGKKPYERKNSHGFILISYFYREIEEITEIVRTNPYDKIFLRDFGLPKEIKYHTILEDENNLILVLYLRYCFKFNLSSRFEIKKAKYLF